jgi:hypothetical protein
MDRFTMPCAYLLGPNGQATLTDRHFAERIQQAMLGG